MNRKARIFVTLAILLVWAQVGSAQNPALGTQSNPDLTQLIAWSQLQSPKPLPEPRPDPTPPPAAPQERQPDQKPGQPGNAYDQQQSPVRTISGTIAKEDGKYVLKASDKKTYQIEDQDKAKQFEGKQVKIVGILDMDSNTIRIQSIELVS